MQLTFEKGALLLLLFALVAIVSRRLRLPYSLGLVAAGIVIALLPFSPGIALTKDLLFLGLLPPLIFEAALSINWKRLREDLVLVLVLATAGVSLSAGVTAAGMHYFADWHWISALTFGVLIAATDPVSVIAVFREAQVRGRLRLLIESESLFNDGTAAVFFAACLVVAKGQSLSPSAIAINLVVTFSMSVVCGAAVAGAGLLLAGRTSDHLVEITITTVVAWGSFLLAEQFHLSGVLATLTAGLVMGNIGPRGAISGRGQETVEAFWEYAAFVANSLIFLLIGIREAGQKLSGGWTVILVAILIVLLSRAVAVYPCCFLFARSSGKVSAKYQHVLFWGGLRGALALALALALPLGMPEQDAIVRVSFAVVAFSIFVQGLTLTPMLRAIGELPR